MSLYLNGVLLQSANTGANDMIFANRYIGSGFNRFFSGQIDDLGVWGEALISTQILGMHSFATSSLNYGQLDVAMLYGLEEGQSAVTGDGRTWSYQTGLSGAVGEVESLGGNGYAMNLGGGIGIQTVPEPSTVIGMASLMVGCLFRRRRAEI